MNKALLSIGEAAELLGVSIDTLRQWDKKDILQSFRPSAASKRYYRREDIDNFLNKDNDTPSEDIIELSKNWALSQSPISSPSKFHCLTNDIFSARLQSLSLKLERITELEKIFPLIIAVAGEIGNNSYNHNIGNWPDTQGIFFGYNIQKHQIVLADRGQGILKTLQRVLPELKNDQEALQVAFTKYISARAPEDRGNGLKFVKDVVLSNPLNLQFYTGKAKLELKENIENLNMENSDTPFHGCIAIIYF